MSETAVTAEIYVWIKWIGSCDSINLVGKPALAVVICGFRKIPMAVTTQSQMKFKLREVRSEVNFAHALY